MPSWRPTNLPTRVSWFNMSSAHVLPVLSCLCVLQVMEHGAKKVKEMEWREQQLRLQPPKPAPKVDTREELIDQVG